MDTFYFNQTNEKEREEIKKQTQNIPVLLRELDNSTLIENLKSLKI